MALLIIFLIFDFFPSYNNNIFHFSGLQNGRTGFLPLLPAAVPHPLGAGVPKGGGGGGSLRPLRVHQELAAADSRDEGPLPRPTHQNQIQPTVFAR